MHEETKAWEVRRILGSPPRVGIPLSGVTREGGLGRSKDVDGKR